MLELVFEVFFVMTIYLLSGYSNTPALVVHHLFSLFYSISLGKEPIEATLAAPFADLLSTSTESKTMQHFVSCKPTINFRLQLVLKLSHLTLKLKYRNHVTEKYIGFLKHELEFQGSSVITTYHSSEFSNKTADYHRHILRRSFFVRKAFKKMKTPRHTF